MRMEQGSPASSSGSPSRAAMAESTPPQPQTPPSPKPREEGADVAPSSKNGSIEAIFIYNEEGSQGAADMDLAATNDSPSSSSSQLSSFSLREGKHLQRKAKRTGEAYALEDGTPIAEFEEFCLLDEEAYYRHRHVPKKVTPFRIVLPLPAAQNKNLSPSSLSTEELTAEAQDAAKLVDMKCFICGTVLQLVRLGLWSPRNCRLVLFAVFCVALGQCCSHRTQLCRKSAI